MTHDHDAIVGLADIDPTATFTGPFGIAKHVEHPPADDPGLNPLARAALACSIGTWLITAPLYHPAWGQYVMSLIRLDEHPDMPPPVMKFPGATHELILLAVDPRHGAQTIGSVRDHCRDGSLPFLKPVNIAEQFTATDEEMRAVAWLAGRAICLGLLCPETGDAPALIREHWLAVITRTLAHFRGEAHSC